METHTNHKQGEEDRIMNQKLGKTIIVLHISTVVYVLSGILLLILPFLLPNIPEEGTFLTIMLVFMALFSIAIGIFVEIVIKSLKNNKFWAWVAGLIICGLYIPSLFIVLGIIGLIGLLDRDVRKDFLKK